MTTRRASGDEPPERPAAGLRTGGIPLRAPSVPRLPLAASLCLELLTRDWRNAIVAAFIQMGLQLSQQISVAHAKLVRHRRISQPHPQRTLGIDDPVSRRVPRTVLAKLAHRQNTFRNRALLHRRTLDRTR
jgi:hypothetical protein